MALTFEVLDIALPCNIEQDERPIPIHPIPYHSALPLCFVKSHLGLWCPDFYWAYMALQLEFFLKGLLQTLLFQCIVGPILYNKNNTII